MHKHWVIPDNDEKDVAMIDPVRVLHGCIGIATESGELLSSVEKRIYYGQPFDYPNFREEIGDVLWYVALLCNALEIPMEHAMQCNIKKLQKRYPDKFDTELSVEENRDREAEEAAANEDYSNIVTKACECDPEAALRRTFQFNTCPSCKTPFSDRTPKHCPECGVAQNG